MPLTPVGMKLWRAALSDIIDRVIGREGGYVDSGLDRGGATKWGITLRTYSDYLGKEATKDELKVLSLDVARQIYRTRYLEPYGIDKIPDERLADALFDTVVNCGPVAVQWLQEAIGVQRDGKIGSVTLASLQAFGYNQARIELIKRRQLRYASLCAADPSQVAFIVGWLRRSHEFL